MDDDHFSSVGPSEILQCHLTQQGGALHQALNYGEFGKYWQSQSTYTNDEQLAEDHFQETVTQSESCRIQVRLTFKASPDSLGHSHRNALTKFKSLERHLDRDTPPKTAYVLFMN